MSTPSPGSSSIDLWTRSLRQQGFAFAHADEMGALLEGRLGDWAAFADSWNDLGPDPYLAATGRQRRRRHAVFIAGEDQFERQPHQPHYQSLAYNHLQGDIARWFEPVHEAIADHAATRALLLTGLGFFHALAGSRRAFVEMHQFRIEASADHAGEPTPEGVHRDGVDFVLVCLVNRVNIASGTTTIHAADGSIQGEFTLRHPLDIALVDDNRVFHGVTPVEPIDSGAPAYRDVLVLTYKAVS